jgi:hypothetical protein
MLGCAQLHATAFWFQFAGHPGHGFPPTWYFDPRRGELPC